MLEEHIEGLSLLQRLVERKLLFPMWHGLDAEVPNSSLTIGDGNSCSGFVAGGKGFEPLSQAPEACALSS